MENINLHSKPEFPPLYEGGRTVVLPTTYFGPVNWYRQLAKAAFSTSPLGGYEGGMNSAVFIEACESYHKQTTRNRCTIATANGPLNLTVPVSHKGVRCIRDIEISDHGNWRHLHWQALQTNYSESAFFEYYQDDIQPFFEKRWKYLLDYNMEITETMCRLLDIGISLRMTEQYAGIQPDAEDAVMPYYQVFRQRTGFLPGMSVLDLLFNEGPQSILTLTKQQP